MAPHIHLGPDGAERLWQRHYKNTHTRIYKKEKGFETEHSAPWQLHQLFALRWLQSMRRAWAALRMLNMRRWYGNRYLPLWRGSGSSLISVFIWINLWLIKHKLVKVFLFGLTCFPKLGIYWHFAMRTHGGFSANPARPHPTPQVRHKTTSYVQGRNGDTNSCWLNLIWFGAGRAPVSSHFNHHGMRRGRLDGSPDYCHTVALFLLFLQVHSQMIWLQSRGQRNWLWKRQIFNKMLVQAPFYYGWFPAELSEQSHELSGLGNPQRTLQKTSVVRIQQHACLHLLH